METVLSIICLLQGVWLLVTPFLSESPECVESQRLVDLSHILIGFVSIFVAVLKLTGAIKIPIALYGIFVVLVALASLVVSFIGGTKCLRPTMLYEAGVELMLIATVLLLIYKDYRAANPRTVSPQVENIHTSLPSATSSSLPSDINSYGIRSQALQKRIIK